MHSRLYSRARLIKAKKTHITYRHVDGACLPECKSCRDYQGIIRAVSNAAAITVTAAVHWASEKAQFGAVVLVAAADRVPTPVNISVSA